MLVTILRPTYFEKFSTSIWRLPFAAYVRLKLSIVFVTLEIRQEGQEGGRRGGLQNPAYLMASVDCTLFDVFI